jgi:hypothetical protein
MARILLACPSLCLLVPHGRGGVPLVAMWLLTACFRPGPVMDANTGTSSAHATSSSDTGATTGAAEEASSEATSGTTGGSIVGPDVSCVAVVFALGIEACAEGWCACDAECYDPANDHEHFFARDYALGDPVTDVPDGCRCYSEGMAVDACAVVLDDLSPTTEELLDQCLHDIIKHRACSMRDNVCSPIYCEQQFEPGCRSVSTTCSAACDAIGVLPALVGAPPGSAAWFDC